MANLIICFGTGRCGTSSLSNLLAKQKGLYVTHEGYNLPYARRAKIVYPTLLSMAAAAGESEVEDPKLSYAVHLMIEQGDYVNAKPLMPKLFENKTVVDVAYYWLNYIEDVIDIIPDAKTMFLFRPKEDVVRSFVRHVRNWNDKWRNFPWYQDIDPGLVGQYYEEYYNKAFKLHNAYHDSVFWERIPDVLENELVMKNMFDKLEIPEKDRVYKTGIRISQTEKDTHVKIKAAA